MEMELLDQDSRTKISHKLSANLIVEAGAGSGKTEEMAKRILAFIVAGYRQINEIVAITFTRKAANELTQRVRSKLEKEYAATNDAKLKDALDHIHECFIGTIHAFCGKILKERPIEAGVDPGFVQMAAGRERALLRAAWDSYAKEAATDANVKNILDLMDLFNISENVAMGFVKTTCEHRDVDFEAALGLSPAPLEAFFTKIKGVFNKAHTDFINYYKEIPAAVIAGSAASDNLQKTLIAYYKMTQNKQIAKLPNQELLQLVQLFSTKTALKVTQKCWADSNAASEAEKKAAKQTKEDAKAAGEDCLLFHEKTISPLLNEAGEVIYTHILIPFAKAVQGLYIKHALAVAELSYQDLLVYTAALLKDSPDIREYFQEKYKTVLIDEFQDTDPIQAEIAMYLTGEEIDERDWRKITPRKGFLFVVADPKQSIYSFRRADIRMYELFKQHLTADCPPAETVSLTTNFRSTVVLGKWYNEAFAKLFASSAMPDEIDEEYAPRQAVFTEMNALMPANPDTLAGLKYYFNVADPRDENAMIACEAENLASIIRYLVGGENKITVREGGSYVDKPIDYRDIMILMMKKDLAGQIARKIADTGIPVKVTGADVVKQTAAFASLRDLLRLLAHPHESAYLFQVLTGPYFSYTEQELEPFFRLVRYSDIYFDLEKFKEKKQAKLEAAEFAALEKEIAANAEVLAKVANSCGLLRKFAGYFHNLAPAAAVERIIEDLEIMNFSLAANEKKAELESFVTLLEKIRLRKITDLWGLDMLIGELSAMDDSEIEENIDIYGEDNNAVRIMNTHKAKGLEAAVVILAAPFGWCPPPPVFHTRYVTDAGQAGRYVGYADVCRNPDAPPFVRRYCHPPAWNEIVTEMFLAQWHESDRLLYVAATRAKNLLVISNSESEKNPWEKLCKLLPDRKSVV
jgi:ATP-dependent helicase/nuclease subunit A